MPRESARIDEFLIKEVQKSISETLHEVSEQAKTLQTELEDTWSRGGGGISPSPHAIQGAWNLALKNESTLEPVIAEEHLPEGTRPAKRVAKLGELATSACTHCEQETPLIARVTTSEIAGAAANNIAKIAVLHCGEVQPQTLENGQSVDFAPYFVKLT